MRKRAKTAMVTTRTRPIFLLRAQSPLGGGELDLQGIGPGGKVLRGKGNAADQMAKVLIGPLLSLGHALM